MCQVWSITDTPGAVSKKKSINVFRYAATATGLSTGVINAQKHQMLPIVCAKHLQHLLIRHVFA